MVRILWLEDNQNLLYAIQEALEYQGHKVVTALNGQQGLSIIETGEFVPEMIIVDLEMLEASGHEIIQIVKTTPGLQQIGVVVMICSPNDEQRALAAGADATMQKPCKH